MRRWLRRTLALACGLFLSLSAANATNPYKYDGTSESRLDRFVQRTPYPNHGLVRAPIERTMASTGNPQNVRYHSQPSISQHDHAGYVGGRRVTHNNVAHGRGPGAVTGPLTDGVYATDWSGFRDRLGRVFLRPSYDPSKGIPINIGYLAEGPRLTDVGTLRPLRKAVLEKREEEEKKHEGGEGAKHGAEDGAKKEGH